MSDFKFKIGDYVEVVKVLESERRNNQKLKKGIKGIVTYVVSNGCYVDFPELTTKEYYMTNRQLKKVESHKQNNIKHIINGTTTIVILPNGSKGIAKLHPADTFDEYAGFLLAYQRAMGKQDSFDWEGFKKRKFAIHVKSLEEFNKFVEFAKNNNIDGIDECCYTNFEKDTCLTYAEDFSYLQKNTLVYSSVNCYSDCGMPIIEFADISHLIKFKKLKKLSDYTNEEILEELSKRL